MEFISKTIDQRNLDDQSSCDVHISISLNLLGFYRWGNKLFSTDKSVYLCVPGPLDKSEDYIIEELSVFTNVLYFMFV